MIHEKDTAGFYPYRTDDRCRDHRYSGGIAIPAYQDYTIRSRVTEGLNLASAAKVAVAETFQSQNAVADQAATGYVTPAATSSVTSVAVAGDGTGTLTLPIPLQPVAAPSPWFRPW